MMKKLRIVMAASLLASALISNANAFTTETDGAVYRPHAAVCWYYWNGMWHAFQC
jgi:hypothetical protein